AFLVSFPDSSWITATDATSGSGVVVSVAPGGYPLRSGVAHLVAQADRVTVDSLPTGPARVARGAPSVPLLAARLGNPGLTGITSDVRVYALAVSALDSSGTIVAAPAGLLSRLRVRAGASVLVD